MFLQQKTQGDPESPSPSTSVTCFIVDTLPYGQQRMSTATIKRKTKVSLRVPGLSSLVFAFFCWFAIPRCCNTLGILRSGQPRNSRLCKVAVAFCVYANVCQVFYEFAFAHSFTFHCIHNALHFHIKMVLVICLTCSFPGYRHSSCLVSSTIPSNIHCLSLSRLANTIDHTVHRMSKYHRRRKLRSQCVP